MQYSCGKRAVSTITLPRPRIRSHNVAFRRPPPVTLSDTHPHNMLSSLGFDKSRSARTNTPSKVRSQLRTPRSLLTPAQYLLEVPRGFSVHVFKSPSPPAYPQNGATKQEYTRSRSPTSPAYKQQPQQPTYAPRPTDAARKPSLGRSGDYFGDAGTNYDRAFDLTRTKSNKPYGIVPGTIPDSYVYERSISSVSDLPGSPASSSSSDTDSIDTPFNVEVSSIRARSSTETLEATLFATTEDELTAYAPIPERPVIPNLTLHSSRYRAAIADDDDSTVVSDDQPTTTRAPYPAAQTSPSSTPAPSRRNSDERTRTPVTPSLSRRESDERGRGQSPPTLSRRESAQRSTSPTSYDLDASVRLPPGLQYVASGSQRSPTSPVSPSGRRSSRDGADLSRVISINPETPTKKSVKWTEDLICPSPVLPSQRRKGWWNRRG